MERLTSPESGFTIRKTADIISSVADEAINVLDFDGALKVMSYLEGQGIDLKRTKKANFKSMESLVSHASEMFGPEELHVEIKNLSKSGKFNIPVRYTSDMPSPENILGAVIIGENKYGEFVVEYEAIPTIYL